MAFTLNPFFWAFVSLFGVLGATVSINTKYGEKYSFLGWIFVSLFTLGRIVLVLPFIQQPRFEAVIWHWILGVGFLIGGLIFILPAIETQPLRTPQSLKQLRTNGIFAIVRHPFYLGEILISTGLSIFFRSTIGLALVPIWWASLTFHVIHEEENLERKMGPFYLEYKKRVKGRILPIPPIQTSPQIPVFPFRNLVFKGGGMKGTAYLGVLRALDNEDILKQIERVAGSSVGAITAMLLSFNNDIDETVTLMETLDYSLVPQIKSGSEAKGKDWVPKFIDKEISRISGDVEAIQRLVSRYGWYTSEYFYSWLKETIARNCQQNPLATFADFRSMGFKDLYVVGTNMSKLAVQIFSADTTPDVPVANAIRISMSIPLFFESMRFDGNQLGDGDLFVDGGVLLNYPIQLFDHPRYSSGNLWFRNGINWETLGFYLYSFTENFAEEAQIQNYRDFISHLYESYNISLQIAEIDNNPLNRNRTVIINTLDVHSTDFNLSPEDEQYKKLIFQGENATKEFLKNYQHPSKNINW